MAKKGLRKKVKKIGRQRAKIQKKVIKIAAPVLTAAATIIGGPALGLAVGAVTAQAGRRIGATAARAEGKRGREAQKEGVKLRKKLVKSNLIGLAGGFGIGAVAAGGVSATGLLGAASSAAPQAASLVAKKPPPAGAPVEGDPAVAATQGDLNAAVQNSGQDAAQGGILGQAADIAGKIFGFGGKPDGDATTPPTSPDSPPATAPPGGEGGEGAAAPSFLERLAALPPLVKVGGSAAGLGLVWYLFFRKKRGA